MLVTTLVAMIAPAFELRNSMPAAPGLTSAFASPWSAGVSACSSPTVGKSDVTCVCR